MTLLQRRPTRDEALEKLAEEMEKLTKQVAGLRGERDAQIQVKKLENERLNLLREIEDLKITKDRMKEDNERKVREVEHKVGLERKRQEFEADQAQKSIEAERREAVLDVRESNLEATQDRMKDQMDFMADRWEKEHKGLSKIVEKLFDRLPDISMAISRDGE